MLETFKARLKAKAAALKVNLSDKRIDAMAAKLNKKSPDVTEEADHDAKLIDLFDDEEIKDIAKEDDRIRTIEAKAAKVKDEVVTPPPTVEPPPDDAPAWFKAYKEQNDKRYNDLILEKDKQTIAQKVATNEKLKGIDPKLYSLIPLPAKEEELEAWVDNVAGVYGNINQETERPFVPGTGKRTQTTTKPSDKELDNILSNVKI